MSDILSLLGIVLLLLGWAFIVISIVLNVRRRRKKIVVSRRKRWQWWVLAVVMWILGGICVQMAKRETESSPIHDAAVTELNAPMPASSPPTNSPDTEACVEHWTDAYRKEQGQDTVVTQDQLDEWAQWCKQGKTAP